MVIRLDTVYNCFLFSVEKIMGVSYLMVKSHLHNDLSQSNVGCQ